MAPANSQTMFVARQKVMEDTHHPRRFQETRQFAVMSSWMACLRLKGGGFDRHVFYVNVEGCKSLSSRRNAPPIEYGRGTHRKANVQPMQRWMNLPGSFATRHSCDPSFDVLPHASLTEFAPRRRPDYVNTLLQKRPTAWGRWLVWSAWNYGKSMNIFKIQLVGGFKFQLFPGMFRFYRFTFLSLLGMTDDPRLGNQFFRQILACGSWNLSVENADMKRLGKYRAHLHMY